MSPIPSPPIALAGIPVTCMLAFLQGFVSALPSRAPCAARPNGGLSASLKALMPVIADTAKRAAAASLDDLGSARIGADIAAMKHETLEPGCSAHELAQRTLARRHRRAGRLRQDDADREALQGDARALFRRRRHQRHLHQGRRADPQPAAGAAGRPHHGRGDRRLPAHGDPRGRLDQSRRHRRDERAPSRSRCHLHRVGRRQSRRHLLARPRPTSTLYVISVCQGEKIPRKGGPAITRSDLLIINKTDLAPACRWPIST